MHARVYLDDRRDIRIDVSLDLQTFLLLDDTSLCQNTGVSMYSPMLTHSKVSLMTFPSTSARFSSHLTV